MTNGEMCTEIRRLALEAQKINSREVLSEQFKDCSHLVVYGAGNAGGQFVNFLKTALPEQKIDCFLDRNAANKSTYLDYPVYTPADSRLDAVFREKSLVVLAVLLHENEYAELERQLHELGYKKFINAFSLCAFALHDDYSGAMNRDIFARDADDILAAFALMSDDHSRHVFLSNFRSHVTLDYKTQALSPNMTAYVDVNVPFRNKYHSFVDCGAYIGDTLLTLTEHHKVEQYFGFEPDMQSYARLSRQADSLRDNFGQAVLLPFGVGEKNEFLHFFASGGGNSKIDEDGDVIIQTVCLDDMFKGYDNLLIKMDIEGAEIAALKGARRIITETKPDLAICVYHHVSDLWRIPLLLNEWSPEYKFYMRNHFISTIDTVLYTTIE